MVVFVQSDTTMGVTLSVAVVAVWGVLVAVSLVEMVQRVLKMCVAYSVLATLIAVDNAGEEPEYEMVALLAVGEALALAPSSKHSVLMKVASANGLHRGCEVSFEKLMVDA